MAWATPSRLRVCVWEARSPGVGRARSGGGTLLLPRGPPRWREAAGPGCEGGSALCWCPAGFPRLWKVGLAHGLDPLESFSRGRRVGSRPEAEHLFPWLPTVAVTASS